MMHFGLGPSDLAGVTLSLNTCSAAGDEGDDLGSVSYFSVESVGLSNSCFLK